MAVLATGQTKSEPPPELAIPRFTPVLDGVLGEWKSFKAFTFRRDQVFEGAANWSGPKDAGGSFLVSYDNNRLYLAGTVADDLYAAGELAAGAVDCIELHLGPGRNPGPSGGDQVSRAERQVLRLYPMQAHRPWAFGAGDPAVDEPLQPVTQLGGIIVSAVPARGGGYTFEAAIPFHHFPSLESGMESLSFDLVLRDHDQAGTGSTSMAWTCTDPFAGARGGQLRLQSPGLLAPMRQPPPLLSTELLVDLPYLLMPLLALVLLVMLLRGWGRLRGRVRWLRSAMVIAGVTTFLIGLAVPSLLTAWRAGDQNDQLADKLDRLQQTLAKLEAGSLESYRGASRDRAVVQLVNGRSIERQRYTTYRSLVEIAPDQFGPPERSFDDLPVRCYWLPLSTERAASFQFDPPLRGTGLHLVLARPLSPSIAFTEEPESFPRLTLEIDAGGNQEQQDIELDLPFADASSLGRDFWEAGVVSIKFEQDLRSLAIGCTGDPDLRLVGISLAGEEPGSIVPLSLGEPSRDGVLTDLRGPYPQDAGVELAPSAVMRVTIPPQEESPERLWLFYRAVYPGLPTANPGARVAEISLHFADGRQKQTLVLEHQVSMFYELAVHNTRDDPPEESPASVALTWVDDSQERHVNLGYPVRELPRDTALSAIEFKNLSDYRVRFRSVVFVNERAVAPQDPPDSPLVREGSDRRLSPEALAELQGTVISIYRTGELSESTLPDDKRQDVQTLPRTVGSAESAVTAALLPSGGRRLSLFAPLRGDGWDGAVLAVSSTDEEWRTSEQRANRIGLLLCLLSTPFLLVLLSEMLAVVANLRFRLMMVMSVASLAPLGLLSLVLVQVLESGHATELENSVRATVRSAMDQLEDEKEGVRASASQWLRDLVTLVEARSEQAEPPPTAVADELQKLLSGQLPPDWNGGFLRLEWQPVGGADPIVLVAGDERMVQAEAPVRLEPGLFMQWGQLMLGVRAEQEVAGGSLGLTAGRPLDGSLLGALAPGHDLLLTDVRGYPLAASEGRDSAARWQVRAFDPLSMTERERAVVTGDETRQPVIMREPETSGGSVVGTEVLRDLQETPRGLLAVALADERAALDLAIGRIPVRAFFLLVAGSLVVLAAFLSFVVSGRISRPIERLEKGAQALSRGAFDTRVPSDEGGQVGRLTRAFNQMAEDLQGRLQDLQALNRTMSDLAAEHDERTAIEVLRRFCAYHTGADAVVATMLADDGASLILHTGGSGEGESIDLHGYPIVSLIGPFCCRDQGGQLPLPWRTALPQCRVVMGLPIVFGGQARGVVLLGFEPAEPQFVDIELLTTVVSQAASACERSQLQQLAVRDPVTGVMASDYFRGRVVDGVAMAQHRGDSLALLAFRISEQNRTPSRLQQFVEVMRGCLPDGAIVGHGGAGTFFVAVAACERAAAEVLRQEIATAWRSEGRRAGIEAGGGTFANAVSIYPSESASAEFLFEAVQAQFSTGPEREAVEAESDASLLRAGVTAVSSAMRPVYSTLRRVAPTDLPILLEGETGVGKEVLTNLVHRWSRRRSGPLVKVNCVALSDTLLASELFGHERGAFTGAERRKIGRFELADGGTLFLDEVGEIPHDVQVALLRALQEGEIDRVGGTKSVKVDVRVIAATNRDIKAMVADGRFREDLYYRLQGMVVFVPALRDRREELPGLIEQFRRDFVATGHAPDAAFSTGAMDELYRQEWPGNIRQLRTTVFRSIVLAGSSTVEAHAVRAALDSEQGRAAPEMVVPPIDDLPTAPPVASEEEHRAVSASESAAEVEGDAGEEVVEIPRAESAISPPSGPAAEADRSEEQVTKALSSRLLHLLDMVRSRGRCTTQEHMDACGVSHRTALRDLQALVRRGLIERVGARRGAFYRPVSPMADSEAR